MTFKLINGAKPFDRTIIEKPNEVEIQCRFLTSPTPPRLAVNFRCLLDIGVEGWVALDLRITKRRTRAEWRKGGHSQVT